MSEVPVSIVTGTSSGFGTEVALGLRDAGYVVVATMRDTTAAPGALADSGAEVRALDVTNAASRATLVRDVLRDHGRVDLLVNNAGILATASIEDASEETTRRVFETNFFGPLELARLTFPIMRAQRAGRIVNMTAMGALMDTPLYGAYCASKHALDSITATLDLEGRPHGIRASSVLPGHFRTLIGAKAIGNVFSEPYSDIASRLAADREAHASDVQDDLSEVVEAVLAAATDADPAVRRLVGKGLVLELGSLLPELERLHRLNARRAGV